MAFEIEWLKGAQDELDGEIAYVLTILAVWNNYQDPNRIPSRLTNTE